MYDKKTSGLENGWIFLEESKEILNLSKCTTFKQYYIHVFPSSVACQGFYLFSSQSDTLYIVGHIYTTVRYYRA